MSIYDNPMIKALHKAAIQIRANRTFEQIVDQFEANRATKAAETEKAKTEKAKTKTENSEFNTKTVTLEKDVTDSN